MNPLIAVAPYLGLIAMAMSGFHLVPIAVSYLYEDGAASVFLLSMGVNVATGLVMWLATRRYKTSLNARDGILMVVLAWAGGAAFATLPLLLLVPGLTFTDAYFEAVSGLTASGGTVLSGLDDLPPSLNMWRGLLVWLGGMGIVVLAVAVLPLLGVGGRQIMRAETPGPMKDTQLTPRITETAKGLWMVYAALSAACILAYAAAGMSWFDAVMHGFTTLGLGGFSSHDASFAYWNSPLIEGVAVFFMMVAGINFASHFIAFGTRSARPYRRDPEAGLFLLVTFGSCIGLAAYLHHAGTYDDFLTALRYATFNVVSVASTTGYSSTDYGVWPLFAPMWMLFLCSFVTCSGSTGGGVKMIRAQLLAVQVYREFIKLLHPRAVTPLKVRDQVIENKVIFAVLAFMFVYVSLIVLMTLALIASGVAPVTAFSAIVASVNNMGPGLDAVGPATTFAVLTDFQTWVCTFAMLVGRLELFTLLVVFTPAFWRK